VGKSIPLRDVILCLPNTVSIGYEPVMLGLGLGLDHILVIVKLLRTVAHVMAIK